ncbi:MAG: DUF5056 domain-containing protein [Bacteroides sp.]|nr:DUF5056 domain-containing protein [Bacteroides sp.]
MMETDDKLLKQFFTEHKQEVVDDGFSKRVMMHLPDKAWRISSIWTSVCTALAIILFFAFDGLRILSGLISDIIVAGWQYFATTNFDLKTLVIVAAVLLLLGINRLFSME